MDYKKLIEEEGKSRYAPEYLEAKTKDGKMHVISERAGWNACLTFTEPHLTTLQSRIDELERDNEELKAKGWLKESEAVKGERYIIMHDEWGINSLTAYQNIHGNWVYPDCSDVPYIPDYIHPLPFPQPHKLKQ